MLRITKEADYGILVLACFAREHQTATLTTKSISEQTGVSYRMVCKIMNALTKSGLLISHRGVRGGYQLSKSPDQISLEEIISTLEGPIALTECTKEDCDCLAEEKCFVQKAWQQINQSFRESLQGITLSSMVNPKKDLYVQIQS